MISYSAAAAPPRGPRPRCAAPIPRDGRPRPERRCRMSAAALFTPGEGSFFTPHSEKINALPHSLRVAATEVWHAILNLLRRGQTATDERVTDRVLAQFVDRGRRFVQKGLKALEDLGMIERRRQNGRRIIVVLERLRGRDKPQPRAKAGAKPAAGKPASVPNVGIIPPTTPAQLAAAQAERECPEPTPEQLAEAERVLEESRQRREQARRAEEARQGRDRAQRAKVRPVLINAPAPITDDPDAPGRSVQAIIEAKRQAMGIRVVPGPAPAPDADPGTAPPPDGP